MNFFSFTHAHRKDTEDQWGLIAGTSFRATAPGTLQNLVFPFWQRPERPQQVLDIGTEKDPVWDYGTVTSVITPEASRALLALGGLNLAAKRLIP